VSIRVKYNAQTPFGQMLAEAVSDLISATEKISRIRRAMEAMNKDTGGGATPAQIEAEFGFDPGVGAAALAVIVDIETRLLAPQVLDFRDRVDQG
jgi:hypothetical protein